MDISYRFLFRKCSAFSSVEKVGRIQTTEELDQFGNKTGPAGLVARPQPSAVVSVEVLVEQDVILPLRTGLELLRASIHRRPARLIAQEASSQPIGNFSCHFKQIHHFARAGRTLNPEVVAAIEIEGQQGMDQQGVPWHPYGTPPVGVSTEPAGVGFCWKIVHSIFLATHIEDVGMLGMVSGFVLISHLVRLSLAGLCRFSQFV